MYGSNSATQLWEGNMLDGINVPIVSTNSQVEGQDTMQCDVAQSIPTHTPTNAVVSTPSLQSGQSPTNSAIHSTPILNASTQPNDNQNPPSDNPKLGDIEYDDMQHSVQDAVQRLRFEEVYRTQLSGQILPQSIPTYIDDGIQTAQSNPNCAQQDVSATSTPINTTVSQMPQMPQMHSVDPFGNINAPNTQSNSYNDVAIASVNYYHSQGYEDDMRQNNQDWCNDTSCAQPIAAQQQHSPYHDMRQSPTIQPRQLYNMTTLAQQSSINPQQQSDAHNQSRITVQAIRPRKTLQQTELNGIDFQHIDHRYRHNIKRAGNVKHLRSQVNQVSNRYNQSVNDPNHNNNQQPSYNIDTFGITDYKDIPAASNDSSKVVYQQLEPSTFWEQVQDQVLKLLDEYPSETTLSKLLPDTRWAKVDYDNSGKYYVVGVIGKDKPQFVCYGVPANYTPQPPQELDGYCQWLPIQDNPQGKGYWLIYQDAITGDSIK
jgi:hypothetical protein